jgi:hypothetical protein
MDLPEDSQSSNRQTYDLYAADSYYECLIRRLVHCRARVCDARHSILASCRFIHQAERFSREHVSLILRQLPVRPPRTLFLPRRGEVAHAKILLHVRCGQDALVVCRLASSGYVHAATRLLWAHAIIAHVHFHHRRRILETLVANKHAMAGHVWGYRQWDLRYLFTCPYCDGHGRLGSSSFYADEKYSSWEGGRCECCHGSARLRPFRLHTFHNKFVSPQADGTVVQADAPGTLELLEAIFMPDGRVAFRTVHDTFLTAMSAEDNWEVRQHSKPYVIGEWEKFEVVFVNDHQLALKSYHGSFLSATDKAGMTQQPWLMTWETFNAPWLLRACRWHSNFIR